jgi:hypothetical protein
MIHLNRLRAVLQDHFRMNTLDWSKVGKFKLLHSRKAWSEISESLELEHHSRATVFPVKDGFFLASDDQLQLFRGKELVASGVSESRINAACMDGDQLFVSKESFEPQIDIYEICGAKIAFKESIEGMSFPGCKVPIISSMTRVKSTLYCSLALNNYIYAFDDAYYLVGTMLKPQKYVNIQALQQDSRDQWDSAKSLVSGNSWFIAYGHISVEIDLRTMTIANHIDTRVDIPSSQGLYVTQGDKQICIQTSTGGRYRVKHPGYSVEAVVEYGHCFLIECDNQVYIAEPAIAEVLNKVTLPELTGLILNFI